ncbi:MAG: bifunctional oligoribonuclease/PAP phosphatase NrnA [Acidobacteria bacterium]|jgi:phosphoesterase RecJ-like protein|nr:bifunctional oligoribonuclease/PAP phosphatase NrnA [Acidobacteriota bacterium]
MTGASTDAAEAVRCLADARRALVTSHMSPDGDALGSELALAELAAAFGTDTVIVNRDPAPAGIAEMPGAEVVCVAPTTPEDFPKGFDLVVTLECPGLDRPGFDGLDALPILNIDHHAANDRYGELNYLDESAPAVGEMVLRMYRAAGVEPSAQAATAMYVALSTDTGDFRYSNATPRAFLAAAELVEAGARPEQVAEWVHQRRSAASVRLLGEALRTLQITEDGRVASLSVDADAFARAQATPADTDGLINVPRAITGVIVAAFFKQWEPGVVRISLRSRGAVDVRAIAAAYGGGGHSNAAGCTVPGELAAVRQEVLARLRTLLESGS